MLLRGEGKGIKGTGGKGKGREERGRERGEEKRQVKPEGIEGREEREGEGGAGPPHDLFAPCPCQYVASIAAAGKRPFSSQTPQSVHISTWFETVVLRPCH